MMTAISEEIKVLLNLESNTITESYYVEDEDGDDEFYGAVNYLKFFLEDSTDRESDKETLKRLERKGDIFLHKYTSTMIETTEQGYARIRSLMEEN